MSTVRRLFEHPKNTEVINNRYVQRCCDGNAPYWDTYRIRDTEDAWDDSDRNMTAYKQSDSMLVQDDTGASDNDKEVVYYDINGKTTGTNGKMKGYVRVEGPNSGYKPDFISPTQWMEWQGVEYSSNPLGVRMANGQYTTSLPNPPRWRRVRIREDKVKWGKGIRGWGGSDHTFLWCQKCETALESAWSDTLDALPMICRGVAMVVSNIPVFGTAISFVIHAAVSLAQDKPLDDAMLDAVGGALPGQPTSGMAFHAGVAIAKGERIDQVMIAGLPIPPEMKNLVKVAANVVYGIASGQNVTKVAYDEIRKQLPGEAQKAMDVAKRVVQGENVPNMVLTAAEQYVVSKVREEANRLINDARSQGEAAVAKAREKVDSLYNQYAAETGYQIAMMKLPTWQRDAISTGLAAGSMTKPKEFIGTFGSVPEKNVAVNETYLQKGQRIIDDGARFKGKRLSDLLVNGNFTVPVRGAMDGVSLKWNPDAINNVTTTKAMLTPEWKRGFIIATGLCEGMSEKGPGQTAVYQTMAEKGGRAGFDIGQAVAHYRAINGDSILTMSSVVTAEAKNSVIFSLAKEEPAYKVSTVATLASPSLSLFASTPPPPPSTATIKAGLPTFAVAEQRTEPLVMDAKVYAQKTADRSRWVDYYKSLT